MRSYLNNVFLHTLSTYNLIGNTLMKVLLAIGALCTAILVEYLVIHIITLQTEEFPYTLLLATVGLIAFMIVIFKQKLVSI